MIIQSPEHTYTVLYCHGAEDGMERFICREEKGKTEIHYTLLQIDSEERIRWLLEQNLLWKEQNRSFVDYKECFIWKNTLILVFLRREGVPLSLWLSEQDSSLSLRLELGKRILERLLLLNMPEFLLAGILNPNCILVTREEEIVICYEPEQLARNNAEAQKMLPEHFFQVFSLLFRKEEQSRVCVEIHDFLEQLLQEPYRDVFQIYQFYDGMLNRLQGQEEYFTGVKRWLFRMQRLGTGLIELGQRLAVPVIAVAGMVLLIYLICHSNPEEIPEYRFEQIGTLDIHEGG